VSSKATEVIVIGGGVIGSSIAYHLACRHIPVLLIEKQIPAAGSSGSCDGAVLLQSKKHGIHLQMAIASAKRFADLSEQLPIPIEFKRKGSMVVIEHEAELEVMETFVSQQRQHGVDVALLDAKQARDKVPALAEGIAGATFSPGDGKINPIRLNLAFIEGARQQGAQVQLDEEVVGIEVQAGRVGGVTTTRNSYPCRMVVNAAGVLAPLVARMAHIDVPIKPRRGQLLVTRAVDPMVPCCMLSAGYIVAKFNPQIAHQSGSGVSIDQTAKGNFLIGSTREFAGYDRQTTFSGLTRIARRASQLIPGLGSLDVIRSFAGLRPYTPDGLPILGPVGDIEGLIMAAGHEGDGIALSPITGELISQLISGEAPSVSLDPFRLSRFAEKHGAETVHETH